MKSELVKQALRKQDDGCLLHSFFLLFLPCSTLSEVTTLDCDLSVVGLLFFWNFVQYWKCVPVLYFHSSIDVRRAIPDLLYFCALLLATQVRFLYVLLLHYIVRFTVYRIRKLSLYDMSIHIIINSHELFGISNLGLS